MLSEFRTSNFPAILEYFNSLKKFYLSLETSSTLLRAVLFGHHILLGGFVVRKTHILLLEDASTLEVVRKGELESPLVIVHSRLHYEVSPYYPRSNIETDGKSK